MKCIPILIHDMEHCRKAKHSHTPTTDHTSGLEKKRRIERSQPKQKPDFASPHKGTIFLSSIFLNFPKTAGKEAAARHSPSMNHPPSEEV